MKFHILAVISSLLLAVGFIPLPAQDTSTDGAPLLAPADLDQLVAPIALYPDPLVALILQASTVPTDVVLAQRYLNNGGDPNNIDQQNWDDSVKGLARYPDVLQMMDENLDWTNQLGAAVLAQQDDVMAAIQLQRAKARELGNLETTSQQQVIDEDQIIQIVPADPEVIYVPIYDPQVVYVERGPSIGFSIGFAMGAWIGGGFDWHHHDLYSQGYYRPGYGWRPNANRPPNHWRPNSSRPKPRPPYNPHRPGGGGKLPGWNRPSHGNRPGNGGNNRPPANLKPAPGQPGQGNRPGHLKPAPGQATGGNNRLPGYVKPAPEGNGNRQPGIVKPAPGQPGSVNRPGAGHRPGQNRLPANTIKPAVQPQAGGTKPAILRPGAGGNNHVKPAPRPVRPAITKPSAPAPRAAFNQQHQNTKHPAVQPAARPAPQVHQRPAPRPTAAPHAAPKKAAPQKQKAPPQKK